MRRLTGFLLSGLCLAVCTRAQPAPAGSAPQGQTAGAERDAMNAFRLSRQMDANGDLLVDEKEFAAGFGKLEKEAARVHADLTAWLDKDKNGSLSPAELRPFYAAMSLLPFIRSADQNGDIKLQEPELDAAFSRMAELCQSANAQMLEQFDRDHDGKLNDAELQLARQGLQRAPPHASRPVKATEGGGRAAAFRGDRTASGNGSVSADGQP